LSAPPSRASTCTCCAAPTPNFLRLGCPCPPSAYELKQKGYWLLWRWLVASPVAPFGLFTVRERLLSGGEGLAPGVPATHAATILPAEDAHSDLLIVKGPWPGGPAEEHAQFLSAARPILSGLVAAVFDQDRRARQRAQLELIATVAGACSNGQDPAGALSSIATALAKASGVDWATIVTYNDACDGVLDRAINVARHSETDAAARFRGSRPTSSPSEVRLGVELGAVDGSILVRDISAIGLEDDPGVELIRDDIPGLQRFCRRAHVFSMAIFPIMSGQSVRGYVTFSSSTPREWRAAEVAFLKALVAQAATALEGVRLGRALQDSREELRRSEERFRSLVQHASDMITLVGDDGSITYQSPSIRQVLGHEPGSVVGTLWRDFVHPDDLAGSLPRFRGAIEGHVAPARVEIRARHRDGSWRHLEVVGSDQRSNPAIGAFVLNMRDISERVSLEQQLKDQALRDSLTRLANREGFALALEQSAQGGESTVGCLLYVDLDDFKSVNDQFGHAGGDELLQEAAFRIQQCVRPVDVVARLGGDEFAVLLRGPIGERQAVAVANRMLTALRAPVLIQGEDVSVPASVGIALSKPGPGGPPAPEALLRDADLAMYAAKARGKSCYQVFGPGLLPGLTAGRALKGAAAKLGRAPAGANASGGGAGEGRASTRRRPAA